MIKFNKFVKKIFYKFNFGKNSNIKNIIIKIYLNYLFKKCIIYLFTKCKIKLN